jgi:hypothetical protein
MSTHESGREIRTGVTLPMNGGPLDIAHEQPKHDAGARRLPRCVRRSWGCMGHDLPSCPPGGEQASSPDGFQWGRVEMRLNTWRFVTGTPSRILVKVRIKAPSRSS